MLATQTPPSHCNRHSVEKQLPAVQASHPCQSLDPPHSCAVASACLLMAGVATWQEWEGRGGETHSEGGRRGKKLEGGGLGGRAKKWKQKNEGLKKKGRQKREGAMA